jgi:acyl-[acyl-carrier-protein]-phospholipid O-acyltransferase/long-chain-fatty-acid--[acyl-carrier-protein] ligase
MIWYKTGDKCSIDEDGFITIVDRYSRFAKLAGEMISLSAVESKIEQIVDDKDDINFVVVNIPDDKKGEKIVLLIDKEIIDIKEKIASLDINPLWIPTQIEVVPQIPLLGSGKVDFKSAKKMVAG